jgi:chromosomal replication initiation ATPase DnaA
MTTTTTTPTEIWQTVLDQLQMQMTQATFDSWVKDTRIVSPAGDEAINGRLVVRCKNEFAKDWLESRLYPTVSRTINNVLGRPVEIEFVVDPLSHQEESEESDRVYYLGEGDTVEDETGGFYVGHSEFYRAGYASSLGPYTTSVYHALRYRCNSSNNSAWPYQRTIAKDTGISLRMVKDCLKTLKEHHIISIKPRRTKSGRTANRYILLAPSKWLEPMRSGE